MKTLRIRNWAGAAVAARLSAVAAGALLVCAAVSCKKDAGSEPAQAEGVRTFKATSEAHSGDGKTTLTGTVVKWKGGDAVYVQGTNDNAPVEYSTNDNGVTSATFEAVGGTGVQESGTYYAVYPSSIASSEGRNGSSWTVTLPQYQLVDKGGTFGNGANPMAAMSESADVIEFKNLCGVLRLKLKGSPGMAVRYIRVSSKDENACLWGVSSVTFGNASGGGHSLTAPTNGDGSVYLVNTSSVGIGGGDFVEFDIVLPAGSLKKGFEAEIHCEEGVGGRKGVITMSASNPTPTVPMIDINQITAMEGRELSVETMSDDAVLPGEFTVGDNKKVQFSSGNLECHKRDASITDWSMNNIEWRFAENQYDVVEKSSADAAGEYVGKDAIGLFGWGTTGQDYHFHPEESDPEPGKEGEDPAWPTCYFPWNTGSASTDSYGPQYVDGGGDANNLSVDKGSDWGCNVIANGGDGNSWRALTGGTGGEWDYLLKTRTTVTVRYTDAVKTPITIEGVTYKGFFIYPDRYSGEAVGTNNVGPATWNEIEARGIVFLPCAGFRDGAAVKSVGTYGNYWSSTAHSSPNACSLYLKSGFINPVTNVTRYLGFSVRLVRVSEN